MTLPRRRPWHLRNALLTAALTLAVPVMLPSTAATAAPSDNPASLSNLIVKDGTLSGLLTLRAGDQDVRLDQGSLQVSVAGSTLTPTVKSSSKQRRATMILVDTSGSMTAGDMATVRDATSTFLQDAPKDVLVGLVSFADRARLLVSPGKDRQTVQQEVDGLKAGGSTALFDAVVLASKKLGSNGDRSILLLTDGKNTTGSASKSDAMKALSSNGIRAELIGFKTADTDTQARKDLKDLARAGDGSVASATDSASVTAAFQAAAKALDSQISFSVALDEHVRSVGGKQTVKVTGTANGQPFTARATVDIGAPVGSTASPSPTPSGPVVASGVTGPTSPPWLLYTALGGIGLGLLLLTSTMLAPMLASDRTKRVAAIERYVSGGTVQVQERTRTTQTPSAIGQNLVVMGDHLMEGRKSTAKTMALMERADLPWRAGEWLILRVVAIVVGMALFVLLFRDHQFIGAAIGLVVGFAVPAAWLRWRASRRARRFEAQLPDVLMVVASSLQSGFSLSQALDSAARDGAEPIAKELSRALAEARIGTDIADALERVGDRMDSQNMIWTAMAIRIQRQVGGNLAETLRTTAATLREREQLAGQVRALSAEGRLSAYILVALPVLIFVYMLWVNYAYISLLWHNVLGIFMLVFAAVDLVIGIYWMRRVVDIEA